MMLGNDEWAETSIFDDDYISEENREFPPWHDDYLREEYRNKNE